MTEARRVAEPPELVRLARVLYTQDELGQLIQINEDAGPPAPRRWIAWNERSVIWRVRHDVAPALVARIGDVMAAARPSAEMEQPAWTATLRALMAPSAGPHADIE